MWYINVPTEFTLYKLLWRVVNYVEMDFISVVTGKSFGLWIFSMKRGIGSRGCRLDCSQNGSFIDTLRYGRVIDMRIIRLGLTTKRNRHDVFTRYLGTWVRGRVGETEKTLEKNLGLRGSVTVHILCLRVPCVICWLPGRTLRISYSVYLRSCLCRVLFWVKRHSLSDHKWRQTVR